MVSDPTQRGIACLVLTKATSRPVSPLRSGPDAGIYPVCTVAAYPVGGPINHSS